MSPKPPTDTTGWRPIEHRRFWCLLICFLIAMTIGHFAAIAIWGHGAVADLGDSLSGAFLGYAFAWVCK